MSGWTVFFIIVGVSVVVAKFIDFVEYIGGGNAHDKRKARRTYP